MERSKCKQLPYRPTPYRPTDNCCGCCNRRGSLKNCRDLNDFSLIKNFLAIIPSTSSHIHLSFCKQKQYQTIQIPHSEWESVAVALFEFFKVLLVTSSTTTTNARSRRNNFKSGQPRPIEMSQPGSKAHKVLRHHQKNQTMTMGSGNSSQVVVNQVESETSQVEESREQDDLQSSDEKDTLFEHDNVSGGGRVKSCTELFLNFKEFKPKANRTTDSFTTTMVQTLEEQEASFVQVPDVDGDAGTFDEDKLSEDGDNQEDEELSVSKTEEGFEGDNESDEGLENVSSEEDHDDMEDGRSGGACAGACGGGDKRIRFKKVICGITRNRFSKDKQIQASASTPQSLDANQGESAPPESPVPPVVWIIDPNSERPWIRQPPRDLDPDGRILKKTIKMNEEIRKKYNELAEKRARSKKSRRKSPPIPTSTKDIREILEAIQNARRLNARPSPTPLPPPSYHQHNYLHPHPQPLMLFPPQPNQPIGPALNPHHHHYHQNHPPPWFYNQTHPSQKHPRCMFIQRPPNIYPIHGGHHHGHSLHTYGHTTTTPTALMMPARTHYWQDVLDPNTPQFQARNVNRVCYMIPPQQQGQQFVPHQSPIFTQFQPHTDWNIPHQNNEPTTPRPRRTQ